MSRKNGSEVNPVNLTIDVPDDLARTLEGIASAHNTTVQQFALDRLREIAISRRAEAGSPAALRNAALSPPRLSDSDITDLEAAMSAGRLPLTTKDIFVE